MIERDDVDVTSKRENGIHVTKVTDCRGAVARRRFGGFGKHAQVDSQFDRGPNHHSRKLSAPDYSDDGHAALLGLTGRL
jgi:hypothetical protein